MILLHYRVIPGVDVPRPEPEPEAQPVATVELCDCGPAKVGPAKVGPAVIEAA